MFLAFTEAEVPGEQMSKVGSTSPIIVKLPCPSASSLLLVPTPGTTPLVWPANISSAPGVDGPKVSPQKLSLIAKFWA